MSKQWSPRLALAITSIVLLGAPVLLASDAAISYSLHAQQLTLHQPVILTFKVSAASRPIKVDLGQGRKGGFSFTLTGPDGVTLKSPAFVREGVSEVGTIDLQPGESYSQDLLLNERFNFAGPGKYAVEGHLLRPIVVGNAAAGETDPGFRSVIEIGPRDELELTKTCETLADQIDSSGYEEADQAALV